MYHLQYAEKSEPVARFLSLAGLRIPAKRRREKISKLIFCKCWWRDAVVPSSACHNPKRSIEPQTAQTFLATRGQAFEEKTRYWGSDGVCHQQARLRGRDSGNHRHLNTWENHWGFNSAFLPHFGHFLQYHHSWLSQALCQTHSLRGIPHMQRVKIGQAEKWA